MRKTAPESKPPRKFEAPARSRNVPMGLKIRFGPKEGGCCFRGFPSKQPRSKVPSRRERQPFSGQHSQLQESHVSHSRHQNYVVYPYKLTPKVVPNFAWLPMHGTPSGCRNPLLSQSTCFSLLGQKRQTLLEVPSFVSQETQGKPNPPSGGLFIS